MAISYYQKNRQKILNRDRLLSRMTPKQREEWAKQSFERIRAKYASRDIGLGIGKKKQSFQMPKLAGFKGRNVNLSIEQAVLDQLGEQIEQVKDIFVDDLLRTIQDKTPVDTGRARAGWTRVGDTIFNPVDYVKYLEFGTDRMRPVAMIGTTLAMSQRILDLAITKAMK